MTKVKIRTSTGWQDLTFTGPQGIQGPSGPQVTGPQGAMGHDLVDFRSTGPQSGGGHYLGVSGDPFGDWSGGARCIFYTTPAFVTRAKIIWQGRWQCDHPDWSWFAAGVDIWPEPVARYGPQIELGRLARCQRINTGHQQGRTYITPSGEFWVDLAASTNYQIVHGGYCGSGIWAWDTSWKMSCLTMEVYKR